MAARAALHVTGFVAINGKTLRGRHSTRRPRLSAPKVAQHAVLPQVHRAVGASPWTSEVAVSSLAPEVLLVCSAWPVVVQPRRGPGAPRHPARALRLRISRIS